MHTACFVLGIDISSGEKIPRNQTLRGMNVSYEDFSVLVIEPKTSS